VSQSLKPLKWATLLACALIAAGCANPLDVLGGDETASTLGSRSVDEVDGASVSGSVDADDTGVAADDAADLEPVEISAEFVDGPCPFEVPEGLSPRCGTVAVPMDWQTGDGTIELAVAEFPGASGAGAPDPIVYLDGGPGSHSLDTIQFVVEDTIAPLTARGDLVFFDQRGAGFSTPRLDCPETESLSRELEDVPDIDDAEATGRFHDALAACRSRLLDSGIDLTSFNSINNAHDVEAIRVALGYESWNLYGVSYGTKLGLEVLRRHPASVRSAVLDSVYPPQVDSVRDNPGTFLDSYEAVVAACAAERACAAGGDFAERIAAVVARYEADPVQVEVRDWISGDVDDLFVTGETIVDVVVGALYSPRQFLDLPELIDGLEQGRTYEITTFLSQDRTTERFFTSGMFYSIACNEEISFADPDEVAAAVPADPFGLKEQFDFASNTGNLAFGTCEAFANGQAPETSNTAVVSDVPTLLMAGVYDPVTPVSWAEEALKTLSNGTLVVAPFGSHGVSTDACGAAILLDFLDDLDGQPATDCFNENQLRFLPDESAAVELEPVSYTIEVFGVQVETVRPVGWTVGSLSGDQYRWESFLDASQLYQLAGDQVLSDLIEEFIEDEQGFTIPEATSFTGTDTAGPISAAELTSQWRHRRAQGEATGVDWFERDIGGRTVLVVLVSSNAERDQLLESIVLPALEAIDVTGL
jgi:pimeloyl-ACP methyl ester carboxylesterase